MVDNTLILLIALALGILIFQVMSERNRKTTNNNTVFPKPTAQALIDNIYTNN